MITAPDANRARSMFLIEERTLSGFSAAFCAVFSAALPADSADEKRDDGLRTPFNARWKYVWKVETGLEAMS